MVERAIVMALGLFGGSLVVCVGDSAPETIVPVSPLHSISLRQSNQSDATPPDGEEEESNAGQELLQWLKSYWYVLLVILVVLVIVCVFLCACILRKRRSHRHTLPMELRSHAHIRKNSDSSSSRGTRQQGPGDHPPHHTSSSVVDTSMSPISFSVDPTPIPSPQPSSASQRSTRSRGRNSGRTQRRNHSPGHSSGSEETIRPSDAYNMSSASHYPPGLNRTESMSSTERHPSRGYRGHRRTTSNPLVKVTPLMDETNVSLHSAHSTASMLSVGSSHSARSSKSHSDTSSQQTVVKVDVKVNLGPDQEQEARMVTAAALAESARQLAQSAAEFGKEEEWYTSSHPYRLTSRLSANTTNSLPPHTYTDRRHLFPNHSSSYLPNSRPCSPQALQTINLDRPVHRVSLDRPIHTFPIPRDRHRYNYKPPSSPFSISHGGSESPRPPSSFVSSRTPTPVGSRSPTLTSEYLNLPLTQRYLHSHGSVVESRTPRQQLDSETHRKSPLSFTSLSASGCHQPQSLPRYFHPLEAYPPYPPWPNSETPSQKLQPRYRNMNGIHPLCSNEYTLANLDLLDDDFDVDSGVESTVKVAGSARSGSLKNKERRLKGRRNKEGRVDESQGQEEDEVNDGRTVGEDEEGADPGDQPQAFPKEPNEHHHQSSEGSKNNNLPLSPTSSSEMPIHVRHRSPPRHTRRRKQGTNGASPDRDLQEVVQKTSVKEDEDGKLEGRVVSTASTGSTLPHSPSSSTCLSSHVSSLPSINDEDCQSTLERQNSLPNVKDLQEGATSPTQGQSKTQSLTRSTSGHSINDQLSSTGGGYTLPGSNHNTKPHGNMNTKSRSNPSLVNHKLEIETQYSYPLQKLLAQPFNPETDDFDLLDLPLEPTHIPDHQGYHRSRSGDSVSRSRLHTHTHPPHPSSLSQLSADSYHNCVSGTNQLCSHDVRLNSSINASGISRSHTDMPDSPRSPADLYPNRSHGNITIEV